MLRKRGWSEVGESHSISLVLVLLMVYIIIIMRGYVTDMQTFTGLLEVKGTRVPFWKLMLPLSERRLPSVAQ